MELSINWSWIAGSVIAYYATLAFYRLTLHPLARFPGPKLAAISRWYEAYYDVYLDGQYTSKIAELHREYGPIIRISPFEVHIMDPAFFQTLYRTDGRWDKYAWAYDAFGAKTSTIFCSDHDNHKMRRRAIAPFFSKVNVAARQDILVKNLDQLCRRISKLVGTNFNLGAAISAFTRDNAHEFILNIQYNELELDDFGIGLSDTSQGGGVFWRTTKHVRWFGPTMRAMPIAWAIKLANEGTKSFLRYLQQTEQNTRELLAAAQSASTNVNTKETMVHAIIQSELPPNEKTFDRVFEEVATVTGAGFETLANVLRLIFFHIYENPSIVQRLREELTAAATPSPGTIPLKNLEQLPYLTAVITEGMRLSPAIGTRAARVTDKHLFYNGWRIPAGTPVGMTTLLLHTDENLYPEPLKFLPERWLDSASRKASTSLYAPFSRGTRNCLGMHLAWAEMYIAIAGLVQRFDFRAETAKAGDFELAKDNFGIGTKAGCNLNVQVTRATT